MVQPLELTRQLAGFVCHTREIPDEVLAAAKVAFQDTIGVALAGSVEPAALAALDYVRETAASPQATIWGHPVRSAPGEAALVNAISTHALDFDDTLSTLRGHPSAPTLPVAIALAEQLRSSGRELLIAYALGVEIAGKLGQVFGNGHYLRGWHNTGTVGAFSATAVAARLHGDSPQMLQRAWGIAAAQSGGLLRNFGTMSKPFQAGHAARSAILAEALARRGFTADEQIFEGKDSFLATYGADGAGLASIIAKLGNPWDLVKPGMNYKRWPCCYCSHRALGGLLDVIEKHKIRTDDITQVSIGFPPGADEPLVYDDPRTGLEGKFSIQYPIAAMLLDGRLTAASFTDEALQRPAVRALMKKVRRYRVEDSKVYSGTVGYTDVEIATGSAKFSARIDKGPGSSAWPMTEQEHDTKFMDSASRILDSSTAAELLEAIKRVDTLQDARILIKMLARG
jgi:2-methylcitrate dehydratase PrpD